MDGLAALVAANAAAAGDAMDIGGLSVWGLSSNPPPPPPPARGPKAVAAKSRAASSDNKKPAPATSVSGPKKETTVAAKPTPKPAAAAAAAASPAPLSKNKLAKMAAKQAAAAADSTPLPASTDAADAAAVSSTPATTTVPSSTAPKSALKKSAQAATASPTVPAAASGKKAPTPNTKPTGKKAGNNAAAKDGAAVTPAAAATPAAKSAADVDAGRQLQEEKLSALLASGTLVGGPAHSDADDEDAAASPAASSSAVAPAPAPAAKKPLPKAQQRHEDIKFQPSVRTVRPHEAAKAAGAVDPRSALVFSSEPAKISVAGGGAIAASGAVAGTATAAPAAPKPAAKRAPSPPSSDSSSSDDDADAARPATAVAGSSTALVATKQSTAAALAAPVAVTVEVPTTEEIMAKLHPRLARTLKEKMNFEQLTRVQRSAFGPCAAPTLRMNPTLGGGDVMIRSETGSGKTLAYALPLLHSILVDAEENKIDRSTGTLMVIMCPTRELTEQCATVLTRLLSSAVFVVVGAIHGGEDRHKEKARLRKGIHVLVCTPGRLHDHLFHTQAFEHRALRYVVVDEADRVLDMGFMRTLTEIMQHLHVDPIKGRRVLVSATITRGVEQLQHFALVPPIVTIGETEDVFDLPQSLTQQYVSVDGKHRLVALAALLSSRFFTGNGWTPAVTPAAAAGGAGAPSSTAPQPQKVVVFVSTSDATEFLYLLFSRLANPFALGGNNNAGLRRERDADGPVKARGVALRKKIEAANRHVNGGSDEEFYSDDETGGRGVVDFDAAELDDNAAAGAGLARALAAAAGEHMASLSDTHTFLRSTDVFKLHGNMTQVDRQAVYEAFRKCSRGVLFCTDVAARGLDIPQIDLIAHYDPPTDERCYVHRVGRTARIGASGESLLFLMPHEAGFAKFLGDATKRALEEVNLDVLLFHLTRLDRRAGPGRHWAHSAAHLTRTIAQTVRADQSLRQVSLFAYQSFVRAYSGMPKQVRCYFDARQLHLGHAASAFAIESTPAELQRELRMNRVVKEERTLARDAQRVRKQGIGMIDGGQTSGPGGATTGRGYGYGHGANSGYHSTLVRKAVHVTKDRIDSGVGVKQGATQLRAMNEFEA